MRDARSLLQVFVAIGLLVLPGCRQDAVLSEAANVKDSAAALSKAQAGLAPAVVAECRRRAALLTIGVYLKNANDVKNYIDASTRPSGCSSTVTDLLVADTNVMTAYAALIERAATHNDVSLEAGTLFQSAQKSTLLKKSLGSVPSFVTKDSVDLAVNGIVNALANHARASALENAVRAADPLVQELAAEFDYYFGHADVCSAAVQATTGKPMQWCAVFSAEYDQMVSTYGALFTSRFPYAADFQAGLDPASLKATFAGALARARLTGEFDVPLGTYQVLIQQTRALVPEGSAPLRSLANLAHLQAAGENAARQHDAPRLNDLFSAALRIRVAAGGQQPGALDEPIRKRLDAEIAEMAAGVGAGTDFASAARAFAAEHARMLRLTDAPTPSNGAVTDR